MSEAPEGHHGRRLHESDPRHDVDLEFRFHLGERIEELMAEGLTAEAAEAQARARFGDLHAARRDCEALGMRQSRRDRVARWLQECGQDMRYAAVTFRRAPGFVIVAVLTAALGITTNAALFAALNAVLLRPLPVTHPEQLVRVYTSERDARTEPQRFGHSSYPDYLAMRHSPAIAGMIATLPMSAYIDRGGTATKGEARLVSEDYFTMLGIRAAFGRAIVPADSALTDGVVAVLDYRFWQRAFAADSAVIGTRVTLNGQPTVIIGVTGADFTGIEPSPVDLYLPIQAQPLLMPGVAFLQARGTRSMQLLARRKGDATAAQIETALDATMAAQAEAYPATNAGRQVTVRRATALLDVARTGAPVVPITGLLFGVTLTVLLIAAFNVAGLQLARTLGRRRELAVRLALGAGRGRIARQLFTESLLLAGAAGTVAIALVACLPSLARTIGLPATIQLQPDAAVMLFTAVITLGTALVFGVGPAFAGVSPGLHDALRSGAGAVHPGTARGQRALVTIQIGLSIVLLATGGLLLQNLRRQQRIDPGFEVPGLLVARFETTSGSQTGEDERRFAMETLARARTLPGVGAASVASNAPLTSDGMRTTVAIPDYRAAPDESMDIPFFNAGTDYFATLGIPLLLGEEASGLREDSVPRIVVNQAMAQRYWPGRSPIGAVVLLGGAGGAPAQVVGVSANFQHLAMAEPPTPRFVVQRPSGGSTLLLRTSGDAAVLIPMVQSVLGNSSPSFTLSDVRPMEAIVASSLGLAAALAEGMLALSALALFLAVSGLYGVVSYITGARTREFGVRMALGAGHGAVLRLVLRSGVRLALAGSIGGVLLSVLVTMGLRNMLFSTAAVEVPLLLTVVAIMTAATLLACLAPALRAMRTSPVVSLRAD